MNLQAQNEVSGIVTDTSGNPIIGANVYIEGTYDGSSTDATGTFLFTTSSAGNQLLSVSFLSFETYQKSLLVSEMKNLKIKLKEDVNSLGSVMLTAGTLATGDNSKAAVLSTMDIVTTAGAAGDYIGAIKTLPGNSNVAEDGRLFVRGGDATEAKVFIDGLRVFQPFNATANNIPTRGRFSSFLFEGTNFSTGGYAAEYGDALSGVLLLNTIDEPAQEKTEISVLSVGAGLGNTQKWKKSSLSLNTFYVNLKPYQELISQRVLWKKPFESLSGEAVYRHQIGNGLLKMYGGLNYTNFNLIQEDIDIPEGINLDLKNRNVYINSSYQTDLGSSWKLDIGASYANDHNDIDVSETAIDNADQAAHFKIKLRKRFTNRLKWSVGAEQFTGNFRENVLDTTATTFSSEFKHNSFAAFSEANIFFSKKVALQLGLRGEHNYLLDYNKISPRASLAFKIAKNAQLSLAYGDFYQAPENSILKYDTSVTAQKASHFILNYLYQKNRKMLRAELYHKQYEDLIKYNTEMPTFTSQYSNAGDGYASGLDIFWRDPSFIKNLDYWVSYSFLDTERDYRNFQNRATPNFAAKHTASFVSKYWISDWKSQLSATYNYASGRPYTDPNISKFLSEKTKSFNSLDISWAYLINPQKILYFSVSNVLGSEQIFNYQYSRTPNQSGQFNRRAIRPTADRFLILGFFWTISDDKKDNQLNNL